MRFIGRKNRKLLEMEAPAELGDWRNYLALCIRMARAAVNRLHMAGLAHSDLSPNNVLVDPTAGTSIVIDIDSSGGRGALTRPMSWARRDTSTPEVLSTVHLPIGDPARKHPNARTDQHAARRPDLPIPPAPPPVGRSEDPPQPRTAEEQELLSYGSECTLLRAPVRRHEPTRVRTATCTAPCSKLGAYLNDLTERAFAKGLHVPEDRPTKRLEWQSGLVKTWDLLIPCVKGLLSTHKWFKVMSEQSRYACPFCGEKPP